MRVCLVTLEENLPSERTKFNLLWRSPFLSHIGSDSDAECMLQRITIPAFCFVLIFFFG